MDPLTLSLVVGGVSGTLSAFSERENAKAAQAAGTARISMLKKQQEFKKKVFEYETFSNFISTEQAGAMRINQALQLGSSTKSAASLSRFDRFWFHRDLAGREMGLQQELSLMEDDIKNIERDMPDKDVEMWRGFITGAVSTGVSTYAAAV